MDPLVPVPKHRVDSSTPKKADKFPTNKEIDGIRDAALTQQARAEEPLKLSSASSEIDALKREMIKLDKLQASTKPLLSARDKAKIVTFLADKDKKVLVATGDNLDVANDLMWQLFSAFTSKKDRIPIFVDASKIQNEFRPVDLIKEIYDKAGNPIFQNISEHSFVFIVSGFTPYNFYDRNQLGTWKDAKVIQFVPSQYAKKSDVYWAPIVSNSPQMHQLQKLEVTRPDQLVDIYYV